MKIILILILGIYSSFCFGIERYAKDTTIIWRKDSLTNLKIKTVSFSKQRYFLGLHLKHKKVKVIDYVYSDSLIILNGVSKFILSNDATDIIKFNRLKFYTKRIFRYKVSRFGLRCKIVEYAENGELISTNRMKKNNLLVNYMKNNN